MWFRIVAALPQICHAFLAILSLRDRLGIAMASESPTVGDVSSSASVAPSEEEREQALLMMANELKPYLESDKVPGDGNCLYHSIAC